MHGIGTVHYYEGSQLIGSREIWCALVRTAGDHVASVFYPNIAHFCQECGEIWAREIMAFSFDYQPLLAKKWSAREQLCPMHGGGELLGEHLDQYPLSLLKREFNLLLAQACQSI